MRAAVVEQLKVTQETLGKLLALLKSSEADKFVAHLYQARKQYRRVCERPNRSSVTKNLHTYLSRLPLGHHCSNGFRDTYKSANDRVNPVVGAGEGQCEGLQPHLGGHFIPRAHSAP